MSASKVLVIDSDPSARRLIQSLFQGESAAHVVTAETAPEGFAAVQRERPDVVLLDAMLPYFSSLEIFRKVQAIDRQLPVIFTTFDDTSELIIESMKLGAFECLLKPLDPSRVIKVIHQALEVRRLMMVPPRTSKQDEKQPNGDTLVGRSPGMQEVCKAIGRAAPRDVPVLIRGESGTGKELVARAIYQHSRRADMPFLAVNCAALTDSLLESELFGHEKGSFTGAVNQRIGKFEQCSGGTLFLDEVGDMSPLMQSKVLRVLQEQAFERVGGTETIRTNVRIIAATNRNLANMVADGVFREDLYYRLNGFVIELPALRDRKDDILVLTDWFLARFRRELDKDVYSISPEALDLLLNFPWPGNVRQLQSVLKQAAMHATGPVLIATFFPPEITATAHTSDHAAATSFRSTSSTARSDAASSVTATNSAATSTNRSSIDGFIQQRLQADSRNLYAEVQQAVDRLAIEAALKKVDGNQTQAAKILGISRGTLRSKLQTLNDGDKPAKLAKSTR